MVFPAQLGKSERLCEGSSFLKQHALLCKRLAKVNVSPASRLTVETLIFCAAMGLTVFHFPSPVTFDEMEHRQPCSMCTPCKHGLAAEFIPTCAFSVQMLREIFLTLVGRQGDRDVMAGTRGQPDDDNTVLKGLRADCRCVVSPPPPEQELSF